VVADLILPLAALIGLPLAIGAIGSTPAWDVPAGWRFLLWTLPDLGYAVLLLAVIPLAIGAVKLAMVVRDRAGGRAAAAPRLRVDTDLPPIAGAE
jgi:hypothetical protein